MQIHNFNSSILITDQYEYEYEYEYEYSVTEQKLIGKHKDTNKQMPTYIVRKQIINLYCL